MIFVSQIDPDLSLDPDFSSCVVTGKTYIFVGILFVFL
jgi:hypothetical protein